MKKSNFFLHKHWYVTFRDESQIAIFCNHLMTNMRLVSQIGTYELLAAVDATYFPFIMTTMWDACDNNYEHFSTSFTGDLNYCQHLSHYGTNRRYIDIYGYSPSTSSICMLHRIWVSQLLEGCIQLYHNLRFFTLLIRR